MDEPLKIAVCEDTNADAERLLSILKECSFPSQCSVFTSGEALLEVYQPQKFDLLLTDIYMGGITGIETVTRIRQLDQSIPVAFVTTSTDHALESYRLSALKYIEKPYQKADVEEILKLAWLKRETIPTLDVMQCGKHFELRFSQIIYVEQQIHHLNLHLEDGSRLQICEKLSNLMPQLEAQGFFCPHKSFAVNLACVRNINRELRCFVMQDGSNVPIRRESMSKSKKIWTDYLFDRTRGLIQ